MKGHTTQITLLFFFTLLSVCVLVTPAFAQTGWPTNPGWPTDPGLTINLNGGYNIDIIQGIDTIENSSGQVLSTENNLALSSPLSPNEEMLIDNPNFSVPPFLLNPGPPGLNLSAYVTTNLPLFIGYPDDNTVLNAITDNTAPSLLLTTQGNLVTLPPVVPGGTEDFLYNGIFADLTGNAPAQASVVSSNITLDFGNIQILEDYTANNIEICADDDINYDTYNIVEREASVVPEASSGLLLLAGLAGIGLFSWSRRRNQLSASSEG